MRVSFKFKGSFIKRHFLAILFIGSFIVSRFTTAKAHLHFKYFNPLLATSFALTNVTNHVVLSLMACSSRLHRETSTKEWGYGLR